MKKLPPKSVLRSTFDYDDGRLLWKKPRPGARVNRIAGCKVGNYTRILIKDYGRFAAHRLIWCWHYGEIPESMFIDHIDRDKKNNRIENLRLATNHENQYNRKLNNNNKSGFTGVYLDSDTGSWRARIVFNRKLIFLGSFGTKEQAILARKQAELKYCGDFIPRRDK